VHKRVVQIIVQAVIFLMLLYVSACSQEKTHPLDVPRGYTNILEFEKGGRFLTFGPFVGYYFSPFNPEDLSRLKFICFNERSFYTRDLPENTKIFEGEAVLQTLA